MIPITTVRFGPEEEALVLEVLRSGQLAQGAYVERFEREFADIHGVRARGRGEQRHDGAGGRDGGARRRAR